MPDLRELGWGIIQGEKDKPDPFKAVFGGDLSRIQEVLRADLNANSSTVEFSLPSGWAFCVHSDNPDLGFQVKNPDGKTHDFKSRLKRIGLILNAEKIAIKAFAYFENPQGLLFLHPYNPPIYAKMDPRGQKDPNQLIAMVA